MRLLVLALLPGLALLRHALVISIQYLHDLCGSAIRRLLRHKLPIDVLLQCLALDQAAYELPLRDVPALYQTLKAAARPTQQRGLRFCQARVARLHQNLKTAPQGRRKVDLTVVSLQVDELGGDVFDWVALLEDSLEPFEEVFEHKAYVEAFHKQRASLDSIQEGVLVVRVEVVLMSGVEWEGSA